MGSVMNGINSSVLFICNCKVLTVQKVCHHLAPKLSRPLIEEFHTTASNPSNITADWVFAAFSMGTYLRWSSIVYCAYLWSELAHRLFSKWREELSTSDALVHAYFCQALTYWEKLLATVSHGSILTKVDRKRRVYRERLQQALNLRDLDRNNTLDDMHGHDLSFRLFGTRPNSWCGVSNEVIDIFGQVLARCLAGDRIGTDVMVV
jgi:hypothetical protein